MPGMNKPFMVAEIGANHCGSFDTAAELILAAAMAGADAVKFQCWTPGTMCLDRDYKLDTGPWAGETLFALYEAVHTPWEWFTRLFELAKSKGLVPFASAFDKRAADFLESIDCPIYKIASLEISDVDLIRHVARKRKPMMISLGAASASEIDQALVASMLSPEVTLLACTAAYPAEPEDMNLGFIGTLAVGLSDHSPGIGVACAAAALGAPVIEKHLKLAGADYAPDASFSLTPQEFRWLVTECRRAAAAVTPLVLREPKNSVTHLKRSLYFTRTMKIGDQIMKEDITTARPGLGAPPVDAHKYIGRIITVNRPIERGTPVTPEVIS
jgi:sialic acid synthase SpsE